MVEVLSIRNVSCDYYLEQNNDFSAQKLGHLRGLLPVLRIFGIVEKTGEKCCAHIYGAFPYILLKTVAPLDDQLKDLIDTTVTNILLKTYPNLEEPLVELKEVVARSIYGYTINDEHFVKIFFKNPRHLQVASLELQKQALSNSFMQPYFAHIPYILQFFIDYDIFGMDLVHFDLESVEFRSPPKHVLLNVLSCVTSPVAPLTRMQVEFDAFVDSIQNSKMLSNSQFVNAGLKLIYTDELMRYADGQPEGLSPEEIRDKRVVSKIELEYLQKLKEFCKNSKQTSFDSNADSASSQIEAFSQVNDTVLADQNPVSELQEETNLDASDLWNEMEMQIRGFDADLDEEPYENETIMFDGDDSEENVQTNNEFGLNADKSNAVRKSGIVRPIYPTVSSNPEDKLDDSNLVSYKPLKRRLNYTVAFNEAPQTQMLHLNEPQPKSNRIHQTSTQVECTSGINYLSAMAIEILALPSNISSGIANPETDPVLAVSFAICENVTGGQITFCCEQTILISDEPSHNNKVVVVQNEEELLDRLATIINKFDPDILVGYDMVRGSFGYLFERATHLKDVRFIEKICRIKGARPFNELPFFLGRIKLEVWRVFRRESPMRSYAFGSLVSCILKQPFPGLQLHDLVTLNESSYQLRKIAALHFLEMAKYDILLLDGINVFVRTSQMARVYGIQFCEVLSRGSQFRVESMLLRVTKQFSFLPPSISVEQRNRMDSPLTIPLNLEPLSGIYRDPIAVLDFQSLYPSVCIAYNYCYSTCLGKISEICAPTNSQTIKLGALEYTTIPAAELKKLLDKDLIHISPTGGVFVKKEIRLGILPTMLKELLDTRIMVKKSMKRYKNDPKFYRTLDAQQLALKLVANVTYGYTAANWSGRMPLDAVADAIVSKGREALENAINLINNAPADKYNGATVLYGDTDSVFVQFKGCSRAEAFTIGQQIAKDVSNANPYPMKLKFEKIMHPLSVPTFEKRFLKVGYMMTNKYASVYTSPGASVLILCAIKRYVGNSYENSPDEEPKFDAKGIETVRRDSCLFVSKLMEKCLKILFEKDSPTAIQFLRVQLRQLERFPLSDFILHAEFRDGYSEAAVIPAKKLAREREQKSSRLAPVHGERLPFLVINQQNVGRKHVPLIDCVVSWETFLANPSLKINYNYYVGRQLFSALGRVFDLVPIKLNWHPFLNANFCIGCDKSGTSPFCSRCIKSVGVLQRALGAHSFLQRQNVQAIRVCNECVSKEIHENLDFIVCANISCNVMEKRQQVARSSIHRDIQKHRLYMKTNAPIYLSD